MRRATYWAVLLLGTLGIVASSAQAGADDGRLLPLDRLEGAIMAGPAVATLAALSDKFGPRIAGSPAHFRAARWSVEQFSGNGISDAHLELFTIPNGWERGSASATITAPTPRTLHVQSLGWSPSTPDSGVHGPVIWVADVSPSGIRGMGDRLASHIVMLDMDHIFEDEWYHAALRVHAVIDLLKQAGALAVLLPNNVLENSLGAYVGLLPAGRLFPLPVAEIGMEDARLLQRMMSAGRTDLSVRLTNKVSGPTQVPNVVAEIRGTEHPEQWILIGAHLDSWDYGTGALDNGAGSVAVMEIARVFSALGYRPRRSIRFVLWGGEEAGLLGSMAYVRAHAAELPNCVAVLNDDHGAGRVIGWTLQGREDLRRSLNPDLLTRLSSVGAADMSLTLTCNTDHCPFMLEGIPAFDLHVDTSEYETIHHRAGDTFDKLHPVDFKAGIAAVAITANALAESPTRIAPRLDRASVLSHLKKANLDEVLRQLGRWKD